VPLFLIEKKIKGKKGIIAYNKLYGTGSIKHHVKTLYLELLMTYVAKHFVNDNVSCS
jgi:hypothetical protein